MTQSLPPARASQITVTGDGDAFGPDTPENRALARRVRACVNACDGLATEDLELGLVQQMQQLIRQLAPIAAAMNTQAGERAA